jgi:PKD repeat protein
MAIGSFFNPILAGGTAVSMNVDFTTVTQSIDQFTGLTFSNISDPTPVHNFWEFSDGDFSTASSPFKTFNTVGTFSVTLNACDATSGGIETKTDYIVVKKGFTPDDITNCVLWLDAADANSFTLVGSAVDEWLDKSGNNNHFTAPASGNRPTYNSTDNKVEFNGSSHTLQRTSTSDLTVVSSTTFIVVKSNITTTGQFVAMGDDVTITGSGVKLYNRLFYDNFNDSAFGSAPRDLWSANGRANGGGFQPVRFINKSAGKNQLILTTTTFDSANTSICLRFNGVLQSNSATWPDSGTCNTNQTQTVTGHVRTRIGANSDTTAAQYFPGEIYEIVSYNRVLTTQEREDVETYLANKWGITL